MVCCTVMAPIGFWNTCMTSGDSGKQKCGGRQAKHMKNRKSRKTQGKNRGKKKTSGHAGKQGKQAGAEESAATTSSVVKWTSWLLDGPTNGLGRQHRHTRTATGWTQSAGSKGEEHEVGDRVDLDGLSQEQLLAIKLNVSEKGEPVVAQSEANDQATAWAEQWGLNDRGGRQSSGPKIWAPCRPTLWYMPLWKLRWPSL